MSEFEYFFYQDQAEFNRLYSGSLIYDFDSMEISKMNKVKFICFSILFGAVIHSGFGVFQALETIQSNYLQTLQSIQNEN